MKKLFVVSAAILMALTSCTVKEQLELQKPSAGARLTLMGETFNETKITIGAKDNGSYPVLWSKGDRIGLISPQDTIFKNAVATLYGEGGSSSGVFMLDEDIILPNDVDVLVYYPRSSFTTLEETQDAEFNTAYLLKSSVTMEQTMPKAGDVSHVGTYALAWAKTHAKMTEKEGEGYYQEPIKFSLDHSVAYVKLEISSSAYSSLKLAGASLWADGAKLTGDIAVNIGTGEMTCVYPREYAVVTVDEPAALSSTQTLWLVTLPCDLTGKDMYVSVSMTDGRKNVTIPVKVPGGNIKAGTVNIIKVAAEKNDISWYEPEETRYLAEGWAYGPTNCVLVTNPDEKIEIDVKARGYFMGCREPKYVYACNLNYGSTAFKLKVNGVALAAVAAATGPSADKCAPVVDGKIVMDFTGSASSVVMAAKLVLVDENFKTLWAYTLWPCWPYKDGVKAAEYKCGKIVMDRNIGDGTVDGYANWHGMGCYFQWGRPFCFGWSGGGAYKTAPSDAISLKHSAEKAEVFLYTDASVPNSMSDWWLGDWTRKRTDRKDDFWGNANPSNKTDGSEVAGTKSIFDPCPKGWMVCSPDVFKEVTALGDSQLYLWETASTATANGEWGKFIRAIKYQYGPDPEKDFQYWKFDGLKWGSNAGNPTNQVNDMCCYYSNSSFHSSTSSDHYIYSLYYRSTEGVWKNSGSRNSGGSVRCMKDVDNR